MYRGACQRFDGFCCSSYYSLSSIWGTLFALWDCEKVAPLHCHWALVPNITSALCIKSLITVNLSAFGQIVCFIDDGENR